MFGFKRGVATQNFKKMISQESPKLKRIVKNLFYYGASVSDVEKLVEEAHREYLAEK